MYQYQCLNAISEAGLSLFSEDYQRTEEMAGADAVLLRSASLHETVFPEKLKVIARAGAGVNNIPLEECAEKGIVVFNTPGANANGVKELVIAGMLLASRDIIGGIEWVKAHAGEENIAKTAEKQKKMFAGQEIEGKMNSESTKRAENALYEFTPDGNSCRIYEAETPRYWYNYLWNEGRYCAQISQVGHGRSYYLSEKADMCMINRDDARYVYLRDDADGTCWNIGKGPLNEDVDDYCCTHSIGHTQIRSKKNGIEGSWRIFVPKKGFHEVWTLKLHNTTEQERRLSIFSAVSFYLEGFSYPRYYEMYRCMKTGFKRELNGIYCDSAHPFAPHERYHGFLASSEPVYAWDGDLTKFCGSTSTLTLPDASACALFQRPDIVVNGKDCTNSEASLFILGGVLQHKITLMPGEEKEFQVVFGISSSCEEACSVMRRYADKESTEQEFADAEAYNYRKIGSLSVKTPDQKINNMMNNWVKKQADFCIVGKKGVRDNLQISVALLNYRQEKAKEEILECLRHQFQDGHGVLTWYPYDDTRYSDQPFWIIWAVCELIKETGDLSILDTEIEWQDGVKASVLEHV